MAALPSAVLFVCTFNTVRSPIAEALLKKFHGDKIYVDSAGLDVAEPDGFVIQVMKEIGIDLSGHEPKSLDDLDDLSFDLVIALSPEAHSAALEFTATMACEVEFWPIAHPGDTGGSREAQLASYRRLRDELFKRLMDKFPVKGPLVK